MPRSMIYFGIIFSIFKETSNSHHKKHVHVRYGEYSASFDIETEQLLAGRLKPPQIRITQKLIKKYRKKLLEDWNKLNNEDETSIETMVFRVRM